MPHRSIRRPGLTLVELVVVLVILIALSGLLIPMVSGITDSTKQTTTVSTMTALRNAIQAYYQDMKGIAVYNNIATPAYGEPGTTGVPAALKDLVIQPYRDASFDYVQTFVPATRLGWRGPYIMQATGTFPANIAPVTSSFYPSDNFYGAAGDQAFLDGWGNSIVLQWPQTSDPLATRAQYVRLVSAGPASANHDGVPYATIDADYHGTTVLTASANPRGNDIVMYIFVQDPNP